MSTTGFIFSNLNSNTLSLLTSDRTVAAIPFGCRYRLVDFALSNMVNSDITDINIIANYNFRSLVNHIGSGKDWDLARRSGGIKILSPGQEARQADAFVYSYRLEALRSIRDRINELTETGIDLEGLFPIYTEAATETRLLSYNAETKTAVYAEEIRTNGMSLPEGGKATLTLTGLRQHEIVDLLPLLKQYEARTDTVSLPENSQPMSLQNATGIIPEGMKILDPAGSLEIPLAEHTYLCGYGWIDGLLHVQIRYDNPMNENNEFPVLGTLRLQTPDGYSSYDHPDELREGVTGFWWDEDDNGSADRDEFLFACTPADLENATLELDIRKFLGEDTVKGNWSIPIPMRMIQYHE